MSTIEKLEQLIYKGFEETNRKFQETDRRFLELREDFKKTDRRFLELREDFKETDRRIEERDKMLTEKFLESKKMVDKLTGKWGTFLEGFVAPGVIRIFNERNIKLNRITRGFKASRNGTQIEIDILGVNEEYVVLVEVKSTLSVDDVNEHLARLEKFKTFFPEYRAYKAIGAVAGIVIKQGADRYAYKKGLFVIVQSGETIKILNDEKFKPATW